MPTTYSHMAFGERVLKALQNNPNTDKIVENIRSWKEDFWVGLHRPDILFYYHPLVPNPVSRLGHMMHNRPAGSWFVRLKELSQNCDAGYAYAMGAACHYILDYRCHPFVEAYQEKTGISHGEIELEMDWQMMVQDGRNPMQYRPADPLKLHPQLLAPLQSVYPGVSARQLKRAVESMVFYCGICVWPDEKKRHLLIGAMELVGLHTLAKGHVITPERNPACAESTQWLCEKLHQTVPEAVELLQSFDKYLSGEGPLPILFRGTFMGPWCFND